MSATRLLVLGVVRMKGRAHGYEVRRELLSWSADRWGKVQPGSIYHALKKLTRDGLLEAVTTEEGEHGPDRTVYRLTPDGETEFTVLLTSSISEPDPRGAESLNAAVTFLTTLPRRHAIGLVKHRVAQLKGILARAEYSVESVPDMGKPAHVGELFRLWVQHADADVRWAEDLLARLEAGEYVMADESAEHFGHAPVERSHH
jgi:DNA-binding PadR family transcriptional regulator